MIGAKSGDRVLVIGARDPDLIAAVAGMTGLNGTTLVVQGEEAAEAQVRAAAERAGTLVEFGPAGTLFDAGGTFDVVLVLIGLASLEPMARTGMVRQAFSALRAGGRIVAIEGQRRTGFFGSRPKTASVTPLPASDVTALLTSAGGRAVRQLAEAEGAVYFEARK